MEEIIQIIKELVNPESIIKYGGLSLLLFVVFAETGLFLGFFLPGDSLLFTAGLLASTKILNTNIFILILGVAIAAIIGNIVGYFFGKKVGISLYKKKKSLLFRPKHLIAAKNFYEKYGGIALILGRFIPIVRTFAPIIAGIIQVNYRDFLIYNISGAILWSGSVISAGYFLGKYVPGIENYLKYIVIFLIIITSIPVIKLIYSKKFKKKSANILEND